MNLNLSCYVGAPQGSDTVGEEGALVLVAGPPETGPALPCAAAFAGCCWGRSRPATRRRLPKTRRARCVARQRRGAWSWSPELRAQLSEDVNRSGDSGSRRGGSLTALSDGQLKNRPIYL